MNTSEQVNFKKLEKTESEVKRIKFKIIDKRVVELEFKDGDEIFVNGTRFIVGDEEKPTLSSVIGKSQEFSDECVITKTKKEYDEYIANLKNKKRKIFKL
ncbi:hypothetical protein KAS41_01125 [Candidatus Parcubacteria bacterium]|nr:hypothetical protein [Candidatus Parcubacteria bacterium]